MTYDAKEEVAASDITPTLRTNASSANPMVERSCDLIRPPLVAPTTLRVFSPLMRKGTELRPYQAAPRRTHHPPGVQPLDAERHRGHGEVDEIDDRYEYHGYGDSQQDNGRGTVTLAGNIRHDIL